MTYVRGTSAAAGVIIRDSQGTLITASTINLGTSSVYIAEATTLHHGILLALQHQISNILIEGDNLLVAQAIKGIWSPPWQIANLVQDITCLLHNFRS